MSDETANPVPDPRVEALAREFRQLSPDDQELVFALVARLRGGADAELAGPEYTYRRDVPFMDFDE